MMRDGSLSKTLDFFGVFDIHNQRNRSLWRSEGRDAYTLSICKDSKLVGTVCELQFRPECKESIPFDRKQGRWKKDNIASLGHNVPRILTQLQMCTDAKDLAGGKQIHEHISRHGLFKDKLLANMLVQMYGKCGALDDAWAVFDNLKKKNSFSWNIMISAYVKHSMIDKARKLFEQMPGRDLVSWNEMIAAHIQHGQLGEAVKLFQQMPQRDVVSWTTIISGYAKHGQMQEALQLFQQMPQRNMMSWNAMISSYSQQGQFNKALSLFDKMPKRNVVSWNAMIGSYAQHGHSRYVLQMFEQMQLLGIAPNEVTFGSVLAACTYDGLVDEGCHMLIVMTGPASITPTLEHYSCIADLLGRIGWLEDAEALLNSMPVLADATAWTAFLSSCKTYVSVEHAMRAAENIFELDSETSAPYALLSNIYAAAGLWEEAANIRKMMEKRGMQNHVFQKQTT